MYQKEYEESQTLKDIKKKLEKNQAPAGRDWNGGQYGQAMQDTLNKLANREGFAYSPSGDALYSHYRDRYTQMSKQAMEDAMGRTASLTGGYANSYAQSAGQQAYAQSMGRLNDRLDGLYRLALEKYDRDSRQLESAYSSLSDAYSKEYAAFKAAQDAEAAAYAREKQFLLDEYLTQQQFDYDRYTDQQEQAYRQERDRIKDSQWEAEMAKKSTGTGGSTGKSKSTPPPSASSHTYALKAEDFQSLQSAARSSRKVLVNRINALSVTYKLSQQDRDALYAQYYPYTPEYAAIAQNNQPRATGYYK